MIRTDRSIFSLHCHQVQMKISARVTTRACAQFGFHAGRKITNKLAGQKSPHLSRNRYRSRYGLPESHIHGDKSGGCQMAEMRIRNP